MKILVSGQAGLAIAVEGLETARVFPIESPESPMSVRTAEIRFLLDGATDVVEFEDIPDDEIVRYLEWSWSRDRSLHLIVIVLDPQEDAEVRRLAAESLNELLSEAHVREFMLNRLYSAPMPETADLSGAIALSESIGAAIAAEVLHDVQNDQADITLRHSAWMSLPASLFENDEERSRFLAAAIDAGAFRLFVTQRSRSDWALFQLLSHPKLRGSSRARRVLQSWAAPFKETVASTKFSGHEREDDMSVYLQDERQFRRSVAPREAYEQAEKQRDTIKKLLREGRSELALRYTEQLVRSQRQSSEAEHIAKSLCDLAQFSKKLGSGDLQLHFASRAVAESPGDAWSHTTLGDAYRQLGEFQKSLDAYSRAGELGDRQTAMMGRAEVLKDLGQLAEALQVLEVCAQEFRDNIVTRNSRAAAVASFGRLGEALAAYDEILAEYPFEQVTRTGRAQVLRDLGRLEEALVDLDAIVRDYPGEFVPQYIRGEVTRELGRLTTAVEESRGLMERFPEEVGAKLAYGRSLRESGRFDESIEVYTRAANEHPFDATAQIGLAETFKKRGDVQNARTIYEAVLINFARVAAARNGLAAVLVASGEYDAAGRLLPQGLPATQGEWVAYHIRAMAFLRKREFDRARAMLEWGLNETPWASEREYFRTALASLRVQEGRHREALSLLERVDSAELKPVSRIVEMHALGELGDEVGVEAAYEAIPQTASPLILRLRDVLADRYSRRYRVFEQGGKLSLGELLSDECDSLLLAA